MSTDTLTRPATLSPAARLAALRAELARYGDDWRYGDACNNPQTLRALCASA